MKKGFTLIELLIVLAIIGIFSSIVLTALTDKNNSNEDCYSTLGECKERCESNYSECQNK